jgi:hypothetical protein
MQTLTELEAVRCSARPYRGSSAFLTSYPWRNGVVLADSLTLWIAQNRPACHNHLLSHIINVRALLFCGLLI